MKRRHTATRCDLSNLLPLCHFCHRFLEDRPAEFEAWHRSVLGDAEFDRLRALSLSKAKDSAWFWREVLDGLKAVEAEREAA